MGGVIHRAQAAVCPSHMGADAGCNIQPHDQCLMDADCGSGNLCLCESPPPPGMVCAGGVSNPSGNVCVQGNCRVDSDCGACGVCQAEYGCGQTGSFYCQTPSDECVPDTSSYDGNGCHFSSGHWVAAVPNACPG